MEQDKAIIEEEVFRIAAQLLHVIHPDVIVNGSQGTDLFNGSAGVILFYLRLYDHCKDPLYLQACERAAAVLLERPAIRRQEYFTLYTGATGLIYLCIKMYEATNTKKYMDHALALVQHFEPGILQQVVQDDFMSGHAGNIFLLTYLHAHTGNESVKMLTRSLTDKLIQQARMAPQGLRWGHVKRSYDCLTGFSHGASGIAYALLQAAQYWGDEGLTYLAEQALHYEMLYYDAAANNWLDLRLTSTHLYEADIMDWQAANFRKYASDANAWAHGAAGVGIGRLYAWQLTRTPSYLQQVNQALERCLKDVQLLQRGDFTLCSGYGGLASFLLQAAGILQRPQLRLAAQQTALAAVQFYRQQGVYNTYVPDANNDPGLFSGLAGVGYFLVNTLLPYQEDAITHPIICKASGKKTAPLYAPGEVRRKLFMRYYGRTITLLQEEECWQVADDIPELESILVRRITTSPEAECLFITDCFRFEQSLTALWQQHKGFLCYAKRKELLQAAVEKLRAASPAQLLQTVFIPVSNIQLCYTTWPWHEPGLPNRENVSPQGYYYIHHSHEQGISTYPLTGFAALLLNNLQEGKTLQRVISSIWDTHFNRDTSTSIQPVTTAAITQIKALLQQYFIREAKKKGDTKSISLCYR
ncbi:lanthionine synthetase LanC family protein [Chitinophaga sp. GbtcB8]|uniref:lanthionine synthetase LanC family protein n=1 Tax=Chitinophaga sp. GbtcB8 TaxID=2824753 RepID=UPI001C30F2E2|nr:lanthionine synthetase LanC family protein [Chitinophaga sp. GbtcB8]